MAGRKRLVAVMAPEWQAEAEEQRAAWAPPPAQVMVTDDRVVVTIEEDGALFDPGRREDLVRWRRQWMRWYAAVTLLAAIGRFASGRSSLEALLAARLLYVEVVDRQEVQRIRAGRREGARKGAETRARTSDRQQIVEYARRLLARGVDRYLVLHELSRKFGRNREYCRRCIHKAGL